jgi:prepilin-type N-terminal cleavage/methylation domain-containing protein
MSAITRRGFTLIELMIALVILGIVSAAVYQVLVTNQRTYLAQTQRIDLQQNIRAAATILPAEFREMNAMGTVGANNGDITGMGSTTITIRAMRQLSFLCVAPPLGGGVGQITLTVRQQPIFGSRQTFAVSDSILVFYEGDPTSRNDDSWVQGQVKGVTTGVCPDANGNHPAWVLTLQPTWIAGSQFNVAGAITSGSPIRGFTSITYGLWQSPTDNQYYVAQTAGGSTQPLVGPLSDANGLTFKYFDATGVATADSSKVAQIEIHVSGRTASKISQPTAAGVTYKIDSVVTRVAIRGNTRCTPCP